MTAYRKFGAAADRVMAGVTFFIAFNLVVAVLCCASLNAGNLFISVVTADAVLLAGATARAAWKALHAKLDALIRATPGASDALIRAEERDEDDITRLHADEVKAR